MNHPQWHYMYRGHGYGPFDDINVAWDSYQHKRARDDNEYGTDDRHYWYRWFVYYGRSYTNNKRLIEFDHYPKPLMRCETNSRCRLCGVSTGHTVIYPLGYPT